jgi:hypothetical protein
MEESRAELTPYALVSVHRATERAKGANPFTVDQASTILQNAVGVVEDSLT